MQCPKPDKTEVAINIINEDSWELDELVWSRLNHPNTLPVLQIMDAIQLDCKVNVMLKHPETLFDLFGRGYTDVAALGRGGFGIGCLLRN